MARTSRPEHYRREVSRVEGFSDAVFAFAITLLVVSLEVPKTFEELTAAIRGFPAFAVCFALLFQVWWRHYPFFRNYDPEVGSTGTDATTPASRSGKKKSELQTLRHLVCRFLLEKK